MATFRFLGPVASWLAKIATPRRSSSDMYANAAIFVAGVQSADRGATDRENPPSAGLGRCVREYQPRRAPVERLILGFERLQRAGPVAVHHSFPASFRDVLGLHVVQIRRRLGVIQGSTGGFLSTLERYRGNVQRSILVSSGGPD